MEKARSVLGLQHLERSPKMRVIASVCHEFCDPAKRGCRGKETKTMAIHSGLETPHRNDANQGPTKVEMLECVANRGKTRSASSKCGVIEIRSTAGFMCRSAG